MEVVKTGLCACLIDVNLNGNIISGHQTWYIDSMYSNDYLIQILGNSDLWKVSNLRNHHIVVKTTWWLLTVPVFEWNLGPQDHFSWKLASEYRAVSYIVGKAFSRGLRRRWNRENR